SGGGPQPAEAVPSDAMAYVRLDLDPSAEQKLNAMSLLDKFPAFEEATGISDDDVDLRKLFVDEVLSSDDCDVNYADDIEPWIGDRLGFALVAGEEPTPMLAVQVSDEGKAEDGAKKIADCAGGLGMSAASPVEEPTMDEAEIDETEMDDASYSSDSSEEEPSLGVAFSGDYMIVAPTQDRSDDLAKDAESDSLAASKKFSDDMDALDGQGFASVWFDGEAFTDAAEQMGMAAEELGGIGEADIGSGALALRAGDDYLEVVSTSDSDMGGAGAKADVGGLPESTLFAASISEGGPMIEKAWGQFESSIGMMGPDLQYMLSDLEMSTGLTMPDDFATLLGEQFMVGVDSEGLGPDAEASSIADFNVGIRMTSDPAELGPVVDKLSTSLESAAGPGAADDLYSQETDDGMVIATNEDYGSKLTDGGGGLGDSEAYQKAVPAGDDAINVVYANFDEIAKIAPEDEQETVEMLDPIQALGLSTNVEGDRTFVTARLTFD
ncbi:MAG: DUF3352 domain-containing protein, partial [Actinomycetia bacterium]|nr:DUF3352 domain-containing protein [Actinomycetes bacterium]